MPRPIKHPISSSDGIVVFIRLENGDALKLDAARRRISRSAFAREVLMNGVEKILREREVRV